MTSLYSGTSAGQCGGPWSHVAPEHLKLVLNTLRILTHLIQQSFEVGPLLKLPRSREVK